MNRHGIVDVIGPEYLTANIEEDEWSYAKDAGNLGKLTEALGGVKPHHYKLDRRFVDKDDTGTYTVIVETSRNSSIPTPNSSPPILRRNMRCIAVQRL